VVFANEWILNPLDSERVFIHSRYKGIKDDQLLYILCLLICEVFVRPHFHHRKYTTFLFIATYLSDYTLQEWIDRYEWRTSVPLERYASYTYLSEGGWNKVYMRPARTEWYNPDLNYVEWVFLR
jgi:hypothetical protein